MSNTDIYIIITCYCFLMEPDMTLSDWKIYKPLINRFCYYCYQITNINNKCILCEKIVCLNCIKQILYTLITCKHCIMDAWNNIKNK